MRDAICTKLLIHRGSPEPPPDPDPGYNRTFSSWTSPAYSSVTDRRLKMGSRRPSEPGDSLPLEEELREQEEA